MSQAMVEKLIESFDKLANCISVTSEVLARRSDVPKEVVERVNQYSQIVSKQRTLTAELKSHLVESNWSEVTRHVRLINGLSAMIRDDAQDILSGAILEDSPVRRPSLNS